MYNLLSLSGILVFISIAYLLSESRKKINWRTVLWGLALQFIFALLILKTYFGKLVFSFAQASFDKLIGFSDKGAEFVFGKLVYDYGIGAIFAFKVLPIIIFISSLMGILYYFGILQFIVLIGAKIMYKTMKISGAESLAAALQVFMGIESMTGMKTYIQKMTRSELFVVMSTFMGTIASSVMAAYASFGASAGHLLCASFMSAPAAVLIAKIMIPETGIPETLNRVEFKHEKTEHNVVEAAANGASLGVALAIQVGAMVIAFVAIVWMINAGFGLFGTSFDAFLGYLFMPFAFFLGIPPHEAMTVGKLLGTKVVFNEFIAYIQLKEIIANMSISPRSIVITTYALCSFANFGSMAIMIGAIGGLVPERKSETASLGIKSIIAGTLTSFITACIAGILY